MTLLTIALSEHNAQAIVTGNLMSLSRLVGAITFSTLHRNGNEKEMIRQLTYELRKSYSNTAPAKSRLLWRNNEDSENFEIYKPVQKEERIHSTRIFLPLFIVQLNVAAYYLYRNPRHSIEALNLIKLTKQLLIDAIAIRDKSAAAEVASWLIREPKFSESYNTLHLSQITERYLQDTQAHLRLKHLAMLLADSEETSKTYRTFNAMVMKLWRNNHPVDASTEHDIFAKINDNINKGLIAV